MPHIFTKVLKSLVKHWRLNRARIALFLDDGWGIASSREEIASLSRTVKDDLLSAGSVSNDDNSVWEPCQSILSLGIVWHTDSGAIEISERRVGKILSTVCSIIDCEFVISASCLASFTAQVISSTGPVECKSYYAATLPYVFRVCILLGCPLEQDQYTKGRNYFLEGEY